jgi:hypothetical protein
VPLCLPPVQLRVLERARPLNPNDIEARQLEGLALGRLQRYEESREALRPIAEGPMDGEHKWPIWVAVSGPP